MSAPRTLLHTGLVDALPDDIEVDAYAENKAVSKPTVMIRADGIRRHPDAPQALRRYAYALIVLTPKTDVGPADDELDDTVEDVLYAIEQSPTLPPWESAERGVFGENTPCYEVVVFVDGKKE